MKFRRFSAVVLMLMLCICGFTVRANAAAKVSAPTGLTATNVASSGRIKLTWNAVTGAETYQVYRATSQNGKYTKIASTTSTSFTNKSFTVGKTYYYYIKAVGNNGALSSASNKASAAGKLARPTVTLENSEVSGKIKISWEPVDGAKSYKIYRATSKNGTYSCIKTTEGTSHINSSAVAGKTYYYKVRAISENTAGNSAYSSVKYRTCDLSRPAINLSSVSSSGKIKISWDPVDGAVNYKIYRAIGKNGTYSCIKTTTATSYVNQAVTPGKTYYYKVVAVAEKSAANSAYSAAKYRTCDLARPVVTVTNEETGGRVQLSWDAVEGANGYQIYRSQTQDGTYTRVKTVTETGWLDTSGEEGVLYYYRVVAKGKTTGSDSAQSQAVSGTFTARQELQAWVELTEDGKPDVHWNEISGAATYSVYRSLWEDHGYGNPISTTSYTHMVNRSVTEGVTYYYQVQAKNAAGETLKTSNVVSVQVPLSGEESLQSMYVKETGINIYKLPTTESEYCTVRYMDALQLGLTVSESESGSWSRVYWQNELYYLWQEAGQTKLTQTPSSFSYTGNTPLQQQVLDLAMDICLNWETEYVYSQSNGIPMENGAYGFVCSGLVKYVHNTVMNPHVPTYRLTSDILALYATDSIYNSGYPGEWKAQDVAIEDMQPGDVLFFNLDENDQQSNTISHCGMYLGNNEFVHSTDFWDDSVCVMPLTGIYAETLVAVRRYLPDEVTPADTTVYAFNPETNYRNYSIYTDSEKTVKETVPSGTPLVVKYTDNNNWLYVQIPDGRLVYIHVSNVSGEAPE